MPMLLPRPLRLAMLLTAILLSVSACGTGSRGNFCELYHPVYTTQADTEETKRQADGNNAVWLKLCQ